MSKTPRARMEKKIKFFLLADSNLRTLEDKINLWMKTELEAVHLISSLKNGGIIALVYSPKRKEPVK